MRILLVLLGLSALPGFAAGHSDAASALGEDWHYSDILALLSEQGEAIRSPDDLIRAFPDGMKRHFTFVFETGSRLQNADAQRPRALVFNRNLIYTFNGGPEQKGYPTIEVMDLDAKAKQLSLREIEFVDGKAIAGTTTPAKCLGCHGISPRPIWQEYSTWKGVYGSQDDRMQDAERENYRSFLSAVRRGDRDQARYALLNFPEGSELTPYPDDKTNSSFGFRINLVLTKLLTRFNVVRLTGLAERSPLFARLGPAQVALRFCNDVALREKLATQLGGKDPWAVYGVSPFSFNMTGSPTYDDFFDGSGSLRELLKSYQLLSLAERYPELKEGLKIVTDYHRERYTAYEMYRHLDSLVPFVSAPNCGRLQKVAETALN